MIPFMIALTRVDTSRLFYLRWEKLKESFSRILSKIKADITQKMKIPISVRNISIWVFVAITLAISSYYIKVQMMLDLNVPQIFTPESNLGKLLYISSNFKSGLFGGAKSSGFSAATDTPTHSWPTMMPVRRSQEYPAIRPRRKEQNKENYGSNTKNQTEYVVVTCYGISQYREYKDSDSIARWDSEKFMRYVINGAFEDWRNLCSAVEENREMLDISDKWNKTKDCLWDQLHAINTSSPGFTDAELLLAWAHSSTLVAKSLIGVSGTLEPAWVCSNFSSVSPVASLGSSLSYAESMMKKWKNLFDKSASEVAKMHGVVVLVSSDAFSFPILASEVLQSITIAGIISCSSFVGLFLVFTWNIFLTCVGAIIMGSVFAISLCLKLHFSSKVFDLLDIVVLIAVVGMIVDFPVHMVLRFQAFQRNPHDQQSYKSYKNLWRELFLAVVLIILSGLPLLNAPLILLKKTGIYVIIISLVSYFLSSFCLPCLLECFYFWHDDGGKIDMVIGDNVTDDDQRSNLELLEFRSPL
jgi:hypothetical protein